MSIIRKISWLHVSIIIIFCVLVWLANSFRANWFVHKKKTVPITTPDVGKKKSDISKKPLKKPTAQKKHYSDEVPETGGFVWPLKKLVVTQKFGRTYYARTGGYDGGVHGGVDFRASVGTKVYAAGDGIVIGFGIPVGEERCDRFGAWLLIDHLNGFTTLYAHLSQIIIPVTPIFAGQVIGEAGESGNTTGPHLHFGLFNSSWVELRKSSGCTFAVPDVPLSGRYDPLEYLRDAKNILFKNHQG